MFQKHNKDWIEIRPFCQRRMHNTTPTPFLTKSPPNNSFFFLFFFLPFFIVIIINKFKQQYKYGQYFLWKGIWKHKKKKNYLEELENGWKTEREREREWRTKRHYRHVASEELDKVYGNYCWIVVMKLMTWTMDFSLSLFFFFLVEGLINKWILQFSLFLLLSFWGEGGFS